METMKVCTRCKEAKPATLEYFYASKRTQDGLLQMCKGCVSAYRAARAASFDGLIGSKVCANPRCRRAGVPIPLGQFAKNACYADGRERVCRECKLSSARDKYHADLGAAREVARRGYYKHHARNKQKARERMRAPTAREQERKRWHGRTSEQVVKDNAKRVERYARNRRARVAAVCRARLREFTVSRGRVKGATVEIIGCSWAELCAYLESKFQPGMSWGNYGHGGWHIDHVIPCQAKVDGKFVFDLGTAEGVRACFHYTNLQPLWALDNIRKGNKILA